MFFEGWFEVEVQALDVEIFVLACNNQHTQGKLRLMLRRTPKDSKWLSNWTSKNMSFLMSAMWGKQGGPSREAGAQFSNPWLLNSMEFWTAIAELWDWQVSSTLFEVVNLVSFRVFSNTQVEKAKITQGDVKWSLHESLKLREFPWIVTRPRREYSESVGLTLLLPRRRSSSCSTSVMSHRSHLISKTRGFGFYPSHWVLWEGVFMGKTF